MRKNPLWMFLVISLILCVFGVNMNCGSAVESPAIMVVPESIWDENLTPGDSFNISIRTDYNGDDIWSYGFNLFYNPTVLYAGKQFTDNWTYSAPAPPVFMTSYKPVMQFPEEKVYLNDTLKERGVDYDMGYSTGVIIFKYPLGTGAEVKAIYLGDGLFNGDLISVDKHPNATFSPGSFDNALGKLSLTQACIVYGEGEPVPTTYGPGTLANVTFTVASYGFSDITIGDLTLLTGYNVTKGGFYDIIDAKIMPDHIRHGFFCNIPPSNDVAVVSLDVPGTVAVEQPVPINVTVENQGTYDENVTLTVYNDTTVIDSKTFLLEKGLSNTFSFSWDTSGLTPVTYTINATATVLVGPENPTGVDDEPGDNIDTKLVQLELRNDVAVVSLVAPGTAAVEQPVPVSVTVANEGSYDEDVTLTVYNGTTVINSTAFSLAKGPTSKIVDFSWNTSGLAETTYTINATATIDTDDDLSNNNLTQPITLELRNDVAVVSFVIPTQAVIGHPVPVSVTVANEGSYDEDVTLTVYNGTTVINSTAFSLAKGPTSNTFSFNWNTSGWAEDLYTINATATIDTDDEPGDNTKTRNINLREVHDVAVDSITAPARGNVNDNVFFNVTVENKGSFSETFNVTTYYDNATIDYTTVTLTPAESTTILFTWNTAGVAPDFYTIKAIAGLSNTDTWAGNGVTKSFLTTRKPVVSDTEEVYVNQIFMIKDANYTIDYVRGNITFTDAPDVGAQIKATYISGVTDETYVMNNFASSEPVLVSISGDVDGDGAAGTSDLIALNEAYGSEPGDSNWDEYCDLNGNDKIDASDLFDLSKNYGKSVP